MNASNFSAQLETLQVIRHFIDKYGWSPTVDEIVLRRCLSRPSVYIHIRQLEARGYIIRKSGWRNIRLTTRAA
jgi:DNA-binding MarR family transcriptional regulator